MTSLPRVGPDPSFLEWLHHSQDGHGPSWARECLSVVAKLGAPNQGCPTDVKLLDLIFYLEERGFLFIFNISSSASART